MRLLRVETYGARGRARAYDRRRGWRLWRICNHVNGLDAFLVVFDIHGDVGDHLPDRMLKADHFVYVLVVPFYLLEEVGRPRGSDLGHDVLQLFDAAPSMNTWICLARPGIHDVSYKRLALVKRLIARLSPRADIAPRKSGAESLRIH